MIGDNLNENPVPHPRVADERLDFFDFHSSRVAADRRRFKLVSLRLREASLRGAALSNFCPQRQFAQSRRSLKSKNRKTLASRFRGEPPRIYGRASGS